ncbi:MAG: MFS transporter [Lachnospiraceae bacterium]
MERSNKSRYLQFLLIVLAAGSIYPLIYLKQTYQETILEVFNMGLDQLNIIYSVLGIVFVVGYFPSGLLSDKFSSKKLLAISLFMTALGGVWFAQIPTYGNVVLIFCIWGIFSVFTFWSAHMKLVKLLSKPEEEGRFFGILDGGRGLVEAVLASIGVAIFARIMGTSTDIANKRSALLGIIWMYIIVLVIIAVLVLIFVDDDKKMMASDTEKAVDTAKQKFQMKDLKILFSNKSIFIMGGIIFMSYAVTWAYYYFSGFLQTNIAIDPVTVGTVMVISLWMRPVGGIAGGFLADKLGKSSVLMSAIIAASVGLIILAILPTTSGNTLFYALIILTSALIYAIRGTYWSLLGDTNIDDRITGVAIGLISLFGYLPDIVLPLFINGLFARFGDNGGYNSYFISTAVIGAIGVLLILLFKAVVKKRKAAEGKI